MVYLPRFIVEIGLESVLIAFSSKSQFNAVKGGDFNIQRSDNWLSRQVSTFN
jgi:hypothetical protein